MPEEVLATPQTTESKQTNWPKMVLAAVLGFGLLIGVACAGYWYGMRSANLKSQISKPQPKAQIQPTPTPEPTPAVEDETVGWEIYTDTEQRFSLRYPQGWYVVDAGDGEYYKVLIQNYKPPEFGSGAFEEGQYLLIVTKWTDNIEDKPSQQIVVSVDDLKGALIRKDNEIASYYKEAVVNKVNVRNQREIVVNGFKGLYREASYPEIPDLTNEETYLLDGKGTVLQIVFGLDVDGGRPIYNQILSTFKFLD